jgi:hypothetical protein
MNEINPNSMNFIVAFILITGFIGSFIASLWAIRRWPAIQAPWCLKLPDLVLLLSPFIFVAVILYIYANPSAWRFVFTPSFWPKAPEATAFMFLGVPLTAWSIILLLKNRSNLAFLLLGVNIAAFFTSISSLSMVFRALEPVAIQYPTLQALSLIQGAPVPGAHLILSGNDAGPAPIPMTPARLDSFKSKNPPAFFNIWPTTATQLVIGTTTSGPYVPQRSVSQVNFTATAQLLYSAQPAWLQSQQEGDFSDQYPLAMSTLWLDKAEPARQHLPLLAWSILNPPTGDQPPAWWSKASAHPNLLWEALLPPADNHPSIATLKTRLIQDVFNNGQPITPANALDILLRASQAANRNQVSAPNSLEFTAATTAAILLPPAILAQWYRTTPEFPTTGISPFKYTYPPTHPALPYVVGQIQPRLAQHVIAAWALAHHDDLDALADLGDQINVDLILKKQFNAPSLLGGPRFHTTVDRFFRSRTSRGHWRPQSPWDYSYFGHISPFAGLPGPQGDPFRLQNTQAYFANLRSPNPRNSDIYARWVDASLYTPAYPASRQPFIEAWKLRKNDPVESWSARRDRRNISLHAQPAFDWRYLVASVQSTDPADYIAAAKRTISPRFEQSAEDFIAEIGEDFDEAVLLPDEARNAIWRAFMLDMAGNPKQYGLTQPLDKSSLTLTRPNVSKDLIAARRFLVTAAASDGPRTLYFFTREGLPPAAPALYAQSPSSFSRSLAIDLLLRVPTPENLTLLSTLASDSDPAVAAKAKSAQAFLIRLKSTPVDKLPKPFSDEACTFFDLPGAPK